MDQSSLELRGNTDQLFRQSGYPKPFAFNAEVAAVFDDMVSRSVPLYSDVTQQAALWAKRFYQPGTYLYDVGCSTGTTLAMIGRMLPAGAQLMGVDNSQAMLDRAREKLQELTSHQVQFVCSDIQQTALAPCSVVIMNYTLQFLPVTQRAALLQRVCQALVPGGMLFLSEKTRAHASVIQESLTAIYENFKAQQGYTASEIARKKEALENVLIPSTEPELRRMLEHAGFSAVESVLKWNNFMSLVAYKE